MIAMRMRLMAGLLVLAPVLAGCTVPPYSDPFDRPGSWQPSGVNDANLRAMVAEPSHLQRGVGAQTDLGITAVPPVERLINGERPALPALQTRSGGS
jgi:hypothetical protein